MSTPLPLPLPLPLPSAPRRAVDPAAALLDPGWRPGAWDAEHRILLLDRDDPWIIGFCCRADGCDYQPRNRATQLCQAHQRAWEQDGKPELKPWSSQVRVEVERLCRVGRGGNSCRRPVESDGLCHP